MGPNYKDIIKTIKCPKNSRACREHPGGPHEPLLVKEFGVNTVDYISL